MRSDPSPFWGDVDTELPPLIIHLRTKDVEGRPASTIIKLLEMLLRCEPSTSWSEVGTELETR